MGLKLFDLGGYPLTKGTGSVSRRIVIEGLMTLIALTFLFPKI